MLTILGRQAQGPAWSEVWMGDVTGGGQQIVIRGAEVGDALLGHR